MSYTYCFTKTPQRSSWTWTVPMQEAARVTTTVAESSSPMLMSMEESSLNKPTLVQIAWAWRPWGWEEGEDCGGVHRWVPKDEEGVLPQMLGHHQVPRSREGVAMWPWLCVAVSVPRSQANPSPHCSARKEQLSPRHSARRQSNGRGHPQDTERVQMLFSDYCHVW